MNDVSRKIIPIFLLLVCTCLLGLHLQTTQEAIFFYREQQQIFLFDTEHVLNILKTIGGLATICAQFVIQFFKVPLIGSLTTALIGGAAGWLSWLTLRKIHPASYLLPLAFLPILFQYLYLIKDSYHYEGLIALLFETLALSLYSYGTRKCNWTYRTCIGCLLTIGLFYTMGSVAMLFALSILLFDVFQKNERWYASFIPLILLLTVGSLCVLGGSKPDYDHVFWMKDYVAYFIELEPFYGFSWQVALLVMLLFFLSRYLDHVKTYLKALVTVALLALSGIYYTRTALQRMNKDFYTLMQMFHYIDTEQWDAIISSDDLNYNNYLHLNCLNLALSHKGVMQTDLFNYPQSGIQSLISAYQAHIEESFLFSQIYYHIGITSLAYNFAFGASVGITHGSPVMTKLLIKSHLIYGQYPAAEKFISLLEKTWGYREWASSQRKFLYNDQAVENDPELGVKRKSLSDNKDLFANIIGLLDNLMILLEENPRNKAALDYTIGTLLLSKDLPAIKMFVERFSGTEVLPTLPEPLQQAVISYAEHDPDYCRRYGVTDKVLSEFSLFRRRVLELRHARQAVATGIADYRPTFWYYLMFSK
ncbi:DUF6057 family protein [Parabacteroides sp. ZJ-118]|uniref:DUF6057 family protein n=1 Tax=Parabacteroides sp. ZJ-118 TaxID=2709398 RepID=UPI0013ED3AD6|nr:DUF6057 family protein [Parabacteroides sp. ZJ-118]